MKKYVSFRIGKVDNNEVMKQVNHDHRNGYIPKYIDKSRLNLNYTLEGQEMDLKAINKHKREQNKRSKRKIQKNSDRFFVGIMTFSETMSEDFKNDRELFEKCSKTFINALKMKKLNNLYAQVHLDEKTPHIHLLFDNLDQNGKSIRRNINPKMLSEIQSLMGECFAPMGYSRGKPKKITNAKHMDFKDYHKVVAYIKQLKERATNFKESITIFDKLAKNEKLEENEKKHLEMVAPSLFQFIEKSNDIRVKKKLSDNIMKAIRN